MEIYRNSEAGLSEVFLEFEDTQRLRTECFDLGVPTAPVHSFIYLFHSISVLILQRTDGSSHLATTSSVITHLLPHFLTAHFLGGFHSFYVAPPLLLVALASTSLVRMFWPLTNISAQ
jgi:hypothetical protein